MNIPKQTMKAPKQAVDVQRQGMGAPKQLQQRKTENIETSEGVAEKPETNEIN